MQDLEELFHSLKKRSQDVNSRIIRVEEKFEAAKLRVSEIAAEAKQEGYPDPRALDTIRDEVKAKLADKLEEIKKVLDAQEAILARVEA